MSDDLKLAELRARIDAIDNRVVDLLAMRAGIVSHIGEVKGPQPVYIRPGREARMLRALTRREMGLFPPRLVHRLWRELIGAFTLQEGPLRVAVGSDDAGFWDISRDHFGSFTPMQVQASPLAAVDAVRSKRAEVAALPLPAANDGGWWRVLLEEDAPVVFYHYPFDGERGNAREGLTEGLVAGYLAPEETGNDETYLLVEWQGVPPDAGFPGPLKAHVQARGEDGRARSWLVLDGFFPENDARLNAWRGKHNNLIVRTRVAGIAPVPLRKA